MRTVLVTGGTGAIGSVVTGCLLREPDSHVCVLIRARSGAHLAERLHDLLEFLQIDSRDESIHSRIDAVAGDVTERLLGLDAETYEKLAGSVTHVIHAAGNVKLNQPVDQARRSALDSARNVAAFARSAMAHGQFVKAEFVSTVGVAGRLAGVVPERFFFEEREFRNSYEAAKAEAETYLAKQMREGLPATIHRPSMVVGSSDSGRIVQFQVFYHLCEFLSGARTAGIIPDAGDKQLDIIPVDYVARAIQASSLNTKATGRVLHLCSGPSVAPEINALATLVQKTFAEHGRHLPTLRRVAPTVLQTLVSVATPLATRRLRRSLKTMPYFLTYLRERQTFGNSQTEAFLRPFGLSVPAVESYLDTVLSFYLTRAETLYEQSRVAI